MKHMHTPLPAFYEKMAAAASKAPNGLAGPVRGLENYKSAKLASLRVGRIEYHVSELAAEPETDRVEVYLGLTNPENFYTAVCKAIRKDGSIAHVILEKMYVSAPPIETEFWNADVIEDRRGLTDNGPHDGVFLKGGPRK